MSCNDTVHGSGDGPEFDPFRLQRAAEARRRYFVGLSLSSDGSSLAGSVVQTCGVGLEAEARSVSSMSLRLPASLQEAWQHLDGFPSPPGESAGEVPVMLAELAEYQATMVHRLMTETRLGPDQLMAIGVEDPGLWCEVQKNLRCYLGLCDAASLSEATGISVIDGFPARDVSQNGRGGPLSPLPVWILLRSLDPFTASTWFVVELKRSIRVSCFLFSALDTMPRVISFPVEPGLLLLDLLVSKMTANEQAIDQGGRLAVQGKKIPELLDAWKAVEGFRNPAPWNPRVVPPVAFIERLNELAHHDLWSLQDILCTATHLIAEGIEHAVEKCRTADDRPGTRGVVCGGGSENGFIVQQIRSRICETSWCVPGDLELEDVAPRSTQAALLALLHVDHVPANLPHLTGAQTPRVLGRLTPGAPFNWHRLLELMAQNKPSMMSLRRAI
ncbi:MAG: hypothetical protein CMJ81_23985 [Planctomycetaceae bacterium]|nr:hypothetical protein [Planctomycetaceae bacterium]MBP61150.1 hypothetical protein [Planctomycetaceae bacterium]